MTDDDIEAYLGLGFLAMILLGVLAVVVYSLNENYGWRRSEKNRRLAEKLGLRIGGKHLVGIWDGFPVKVSIRPTIELYIDVGRPKGPSVWQFVDRKWAEDFAGPGGVSVATGDPAFDHQFFLRAPDPARATQVLTPDVRQSLLQARSEGVDLRATGLTYSFDGDVTVPKLKTHLDAATRVAKAARIGSPA